MAMALLMMLVYVTKSGGGRANIKRKLKYISLLLLLSCLPVNFISWRTISRPNFAVFRRFFSVFCVKTTNTGQLNSARERESTAKANRGSENLISNKLPPHQTRSGLLQILR